MSSSFERKVVVYLIMILRYDGEVKTNLENGNARVWLGLFFLAYGVNRIFEPILIRND